MISGSTTTIIEGLLRCQGRRQQDTTNQPNKILRTSTTMVGSSIAVAYFKPRFQRDYQFAMHRFGY